MRRSLAALLLVALSASCGTSPQRAPNSSPSTGPEAQLTSTEYLKAHGVRIDWQTPQSLHGLTVAVPDLPLWKTAEPTAPEDYLHYVDQDQSAQIDGSAPSARILVGELVGGQFDAPEAMAHGPIGPARLPGYQSINSRADSLRGAPGWYAEGVFDDEGHRTHRWNRRALVDTGTKKFFLELIVLAPEQRNRSVDADIAALLGGFSAKAT